MRWVFGAATLLGLFSTAQAYRLTALTSKMPSDLAIGPLLTLNFTFWFVPALLAPIIFKLVHRFPIDGHRMKAFAVHAFSALCFAAVHAAAMVVVRSVLYGPAPI
jgi:hypothetical protein